MSHISHNQRLSEISRTSYKEHLMCTSRQSPSSATESLRMDPDNVLRNVEVGLGNVSNQSFRDQGQGTSHTFIPVTNLSQKLNASRHQRYNMMISGRKILRLSCPRLTTTKVSVIMIPDI